MRDSSNHGPLNVEITEIEVSHRAYALGFGRGPLR